MHIVCAFRAEAQQQHTKTCICVLTLRQLQQGDKVVRALLDLFHQLRKAEGASHTSALDPFALRFALKDQFVLGKQLLLQITLLWLTHKAGCKATLTSLTLTAQLSINGLHSFV